MNMRLSLCLLFTCLFDTGCRTPIHGAVDLAIRDVTVLDGTGAVARSGRTVLVAGGRIAGILAGSFEGHAEREIDGSGLFLIPGLIDAHTHPSPAGPIELSDEQLASVFEPMLRFGVTTAVIYGGSRGSYHSMEDLASRSQEGSIDTPRLLYTSPITSIEGAHPVRTYTKNNWVEGETILIPRSLEDIDGIVAEAAARDAIGVKIIVEDGPQPPFIEPMPASWVERFVQKGRELGVPIYAHVSDMNEVRTCVEAGVHALVHYWGVELDWATDAAVIDRMVERDISWVTTLVLGKGMIYYPLHPEWLERAELRTNFDGDLLASLGGRDEAARARPLLETWTGDPDLPMDEFFAPDVAGIAQAYRRGINMVLGTDVGNHCVFPGFSLHEEMEILQTGGMRPLEILRMGTHNPARMLGRSDDLGTLEVGKLADMLLLRSDPSEDVANMRDIERVFISGQERYRRDSPGR